MYNDNKLEERKNKFQKVEMHILEARQNHKLSLRKKKIDELISKKRESAIEKSEKKEFEIDPNLLNIEEHGEKQFSTNSEMYSWFNFILTQENKTLDEVKFVIFLLRKQTVFDKFEHISLMSQTKLLITLGNVLEQLIDDKMVVNEIIWVLTNSTSEDSPELLNILTNDTFLNLYSHIFDIYPCYIIQEGLISLLGNICSSVEIRSRILSHPTSLFDKICELLNSNKIHESVLRISIWFISMLTRFDQLEESVMLKACHYIINWMKVDDEEIRTNCLWALSRLTETDNSDLHDYVLSSGVCQFVFTIQDKKYIIPTVRMLGNLLSLEKRVIDYLIELGVISFLQKFLYHKMSINKRETLWAISNITAGTNEQIKHVIRSGTMAIALHLVNDSDRDVAREAAYLVSNAIATGDNEVLSMMSDINFIDVFANFINKKKDAEIIIVILGTIKCYLEKGEIDRMYLDNSSDEEHVNTHADYFESRNGVSLLENLQFVKHEEIYRLATYMLEKFYLDKIKSRF